MQIPAQLPELSVPLTSRTDLPAIQPIAAVPGVPELVQALDTRVALQWAQPVIPDEHAQTLKQSTESLPSQTTQTLAAALIELDAHPTGDGPALIGRWLSQVMASQKGPSVPWPVASESMAPTMTSLTSGSGFMAPGASPQALQLLAQMQGLFAALMQSPLFAASRLAQRAQRGSMSLQQTNSPADVSTGAVTPAETEGVLWATDLSAVAPDADAAQQAALCLTSGNMTWQGGLVSGFPAEIRREDAWREAPHAPGQIEKGVSLTLQTTLPSLGPFKVIARQWGDELWISVGATEPQGAELKSQISSLQERLGPVAPVGQVHVQWQDESS